MAEQAQKPNYARLMYDTISHSPLRGGYLYGPVESQQELLSKYDYGVGPNQSVDVLRSQRQGGWEQLGHAAMQSLAEIGGGTVEGLGYLLELGNLDSIMNASEEEFGNAISDFGKNIKESSREAFPIYQDYGEGFHPGNWSWWMTNMPSIASSISLMIPSGIATGAVASLVKASGLLGKLTPLGSTVAKGVTQAVFSRHMENMMEASQTWDELYKTNIQDGLSPEDARKNASIGASTVYNRNWAMLAQDIPQYIMLGTGLKGMKALRAAGDDVAKGLTVAGKTIIPGTIKPALNLVKTMVGEGFEEGYQFVVQKEAEYIAQKALDPTIESDSSDRMKEYLKDGDLWTAAFFGAMGAGVMQASAGINEKLTRARLDNRAAKSWGTETARAVKTNLLTQELGNEALVSSARDNSVANILTKESASQRLGKFRDYINSFTDEVIDQEEAAKYNLTPEEVKDVASNKEELLSDINRYEEIFNSNQERLNKNQFKSQEHAILASRNEFLIEKLNSRVNESEAKIEKDVNSTIGFSKLSSAGKKIARINAENNAISNMIKVTKKLIEDDPESSKVDAYNTLVSTLEADLKANKEDVKATREATDAETNEKDSKIKVSGRALYDLQKEVNNITALSASIASLEDSLIKLENGELPYKPSKKVETKDKTDIDQNIPRLGDAVSYTNPETGEVTLGKVVNIEKKSNYTIVPFDTGVPYGGLKKVSIENLKRLMTEEQPEADGTEPISPTDAPIEFGADDDRVNIKGITSPANSLQWWTGKGTNEKLNQIVSNPFLDKEVKDGATLTFSIPKEALDKLPAWSEISLDTKKEDVYDKDPVDIIPIQVKLEIAGEVFEDIYIHRTDYPNIHESVDATVARRELRKVRKNILEIVKAGKVPVAKGININTKGHPNNVNEFGLSIPKAWNINSGEISLGIVDQNAVLNFGGGALEYQGPKTKGTIFAKTVKTVNKDAGLVRVYPTKLSVEHANILWDALRILYTKGYTASMNHPKVEGLSAGDVVRMLVYMGESQTSLEHPNNSTREYLRSKQMWAKDDDGTPALYFGHNPKSNSPYKVYLNNNVAKEEFVSWVTTNKNYNTPIQDKQLGVSGLNAPWGRKFKLGLISYDGTGRYSDILIDNALVTTNVREYLPGTVFSGPVIQFNEDSIASKSNKKPKAPRQPKDVAKPIKTEDITEEKSVIPEAAKIEDKTVKEATTLPSMRNRRKSALREKRGEDATIQQDLKKELRDVKRMLGKKIGDVKEVDKIIDVASQGKKAWATYQHDLITIYNAAETGTIYHEAFHRVSLGYLTPEEREGVHEEAIRKFGLRGLKPTEVDNELGERFRVFVLSNGKRKFSEKVAAFFTRLLAHIKAFFVGPYRLTSYDVDRLFNAIYSGKFAASKIRQDAYPLDGEILRQLYGHEFDTIDTVTQLKETVKTLAHDLIVYSKISDLNQEVKELDWATLKNNILDTIKNIQIQINDGIEVDLNKTRLSYWNDILGYDPTSGNYEGFEVMKELVASFLSSMNIKVHRRDDPEEITGEDQSRPAFDKQSFEISVKENSLGSVKLNVALLQSNEVNPITGGYTFVDYEDTWNSLLADLYEFNTIEDMMNKIKELIPVRPGYDQLYDILVDNKNNLFQAQFLATMRKHKHAFIDALVSVKNGKPIAFELLDADIKSLSRVKVNEWGLNFYFSNAFVKVEGQRPALADTFKNELKADFDNLDNKVRKEYAKPEFIENIDEYIKVAISLLAKVNINVDALTIDKILEEKNKPINEAFIEFVTTDLGKLVNNVILNYDSTKEKAPHASKLYNDSAVNFFGNAYAKAHPEQMTVMVLGPASAQYYIFANHSIVSSLIRDIKLNPEIAQRLLTKRFNSRSKFLFQLFYKEDIRNRVRVRTFAGIKRKESGDVGRDYLAMTQLEDYALKLHASLNGLVVFPTLSDKKTYYFLEGFELPELQLLNGKVSPEIVDIFYKHALDEYDRITSARAERDNGIVDENSGISTYHQVDGDLTKGRAYDFVVFKGLNYDTFNEETAKAAIEQMLNDHIAAEIAYAKSLGIEEVIDKSLEFKYRSKYGIEEGTAFESIIAEYALRSMDTSLELHKMYIGDPAFYKSADDISKRLGELIASGEEMADKVPGWNEDLIKKTFTVLTLKIQLTPSVYYDSLHTEFMKVYDNKSRVDKILAPYKKMDVADGQAFVTPEMYRSISIRIGEWSNDKERAYEILQSGDSMPAEIEKEALAVVLNPLKTVYFGYEVIDDILVPTYDKMSMAPLFRRAVKGTDIEQLLNTMEARNIDMAKMDSAVKVGGHGAVPLWKDKYQSEMNDLSTAPVFEQQFKNLRRQQVTPIHETERSLVGTQFIKIGMSNLNMTEQVYEFEGKKTGREIETIINSGISQLAKQGKEEIDQELGYSNGKVDKKKIVEKLRRDAEDSNMPLSVQQAIKEEDGKFYLEMDSQPNRKWFYSRLISAIVKKVINRKLPGGQFIQVSNLGFRKATTDVTFSLENRAEWLKSKNDIPFIHTENGKIIPMGCVISINAFRHAIPNYDKLTWQQKVDFIKEHDLDMIGYRIPTQGQNSTVALKVVGILPEQFGDSIILPSEFTSLTGSDFDIDKLFIIRKNYTIDNKTKKLKEIDYITNDDAKAYTRMVMYKFGIYKNDFSKEFKEWYRETNLNRIEEIGDKIDEEIRQLEARLDSAKEENKPRLEERIAKKYAKRDAIREERDIYLFNLKGLNKESREELKNRIIEELKIVNAISTFEDFKKLSDLEKNIPKAIENRVINAYISILTSPHHFTKTAAPLGSLKDYLQKEAQAVREKYESVEESPMLFLTPRAQSDIKFKFSSGKEGIGPFALHNAHHVITQLVEYKIAGGISPLQKYVSITSKLDQSQINVLDLSIIKGQDDVDVTDWLSALIDAHVDLAKDPYIMDLNVNAFTYDIISYLIRTGVGYSAFKFLSNPAIREASKLFLATRKSSYRISSSSWNGVVDRIIESYALDLGYDMKDPEERNLVLSTAKNITPSILDGKLKVEEKWLEDNTSKDFFWNQIAILLKLKEIRVDAQLLTNDVQSSQIDTKKFGSSIIGLEAFFNKIRNSIKQSDAGFTYGYKSIVPYDEETLISEKKRPHEVFIADYYREGLVHILDVFSDITIETTPLFRDGVKALLWMTGKKNTIDESVIDDMGNELYSALLGHFFFADILGINSANVRAILSGKNNLFMRYDSLKEKYPELFETNSFLSRLRTYVDESSIVKNYFSLIDAEHKDAFEVDDVVYSWEEIAAKDDPELVKFARHLFLYSFYTTGFNRQIFGFNGFIPPSFMKEYKTTEGVKSLDDTVKGLLSGLKSDNLYPLLARVIDDILSHHHVVPDVSDILTAFENPSFYNMPTSTGTVYYKDNSRLKIGVSKNGEIIAYPYLSYEGKDYKYEGSITFPNNNDKPKFVYTEIDRRGHSAQGRFVHEYGLDSALYAEQSKSSPSAIPSNMTQIVADRFDGQWNPVSPVESFFDIMMEKDALEVGIAPEQEQLMKVTTDMKVIADPNATGTPEMRSANLSTKEHPLEVFTDGSAVKKKDILGYGIWLEYNGTEYGISGAKTEVSKLEEQFPDAEISNPTMELLALTALLRNFANTGEHLVIMQDYTGVVNYDGLWQRSLTSLKRDDKPWGAKKPYIKYLVERATKYIEQIEQNGGSVSIKWVPSDITEEERHEYPELFPDEATYQRLKKGHDKSDLVAKSTVSRDTLKNLLALRIEPNVVSMADISKNVEVTQGNLFDQKTLDEGNDIMNECKGKA